MANSKKGLLEEAIVAAKAVRETAIQHAYRELEESLTPSIKEALAQKLEEELDLDEGKMTGMAGFKPVKESTKNVKPLSEEEEEEVTDEEEDVVEPEEEDAVSAEEEVEEPEEEDKPEDGETADTEDEEPSDDTELKDLTLGDLKELIASMVSAIAPEKPAEQPEDMEPADVQGKGEEEVPVGGEEGAEELNITADEEAADDTESQENGEEKEGEDVEIDLTELLKELESEEHDRKVVTHKQDSEFQKELDEVKKERDEALKTLSELQGTLKEINLMNAKLSCTSQLLSKPLSESQKVRAIRSLDEAQTPKEAKAIYKTLVECFTSENEIASKTQKTKTTLKEHKGSASRAAGRSTAAPIIEVDATVRRLQQLAGIIE